MNGFMFLDVTLALATHLTYSTELQTNYCTEKRYGAKVAYFRTMPQQSPNYEQPSSGQTVSRPRFEHATS